MSELNSLLLQAIREKYRYPAYAELANTKAVGQSVNTEDLFDLPFDSQTKPSLQSVARALSALIKNSVEEDFIGRSVSGSQINQNKLEIVKGVIAIRLAERDAETQKAQRKARKEELLSLLAEKENQELASRTPEEIRKLIDELG